jgi:hypothetical protein
MDDDTNQDATPDQAAPTGPSAMRILPEAVWGTPNGGPKVSQTEAVQQPGPVGRGSDLDEWYPESWWAWKRGSGSRVGAGPHTAEHSSSESADAVVSDQKAAHPDQGQEVEAGPDHERPLFDVEELGSPAPAPTLDDEFAFLAPPAAFADLDPESQPMDDPVDSDESGEAEEAREDEEAGTSPNDGTGGQAIAWDAPSDQMDIPDQWVFGGSRFGGSRRKRSARPEAPKPAGKRSRLRRRHAEPESSPLFGPEEEGEALVSAGRDERGHA